MRCGVTPQLLQTPSSQRGAGMIEVLVALLVLAIGLMGVMSMQLTGARSNQRAIFVTEAQLITEDMVNMITAFDDISVGDGGTAVLYQNLETEYGLTRLDCSDGCDRNQQIDHDRREWSIQIENRLPGGFGQVLLKPAGGRSILVITVMWDANLSGAMGQPVALNGGVVECPDDLACYSVEVRI